MLKSLKILLLEDRIEDVELIKRALIRQKFEFSLVHVENKVEFSSQLKNFNPDVILSDYSLPGFNGLDALNMVMLQSLDIPFIFVTGSINEQTAVDCIIKGATDYILKDNLNRLMPAIINALDKYKSKREKLQAQQALRETEEKFSHAFNFANIGMCLIDLNGRFIQINSKFSSISGYSHDELLNMTVYDITIEEEKEISQQFYTNLVLNGYDSSELEKRYIHKDGHLVSVFISISLINDVNGKPDFFVSHIQDITRKKADEELIRKLSKSVEQSPVMVVISDLSGTIEYVNSKFEEVTGYTCQEITNKNINILKSEHQNNKLYDTLWGVVEHGNIWKGEQLNRKKNGDEYWESATISVLTDSLNKPTHIIAVKQDITEKKKLEQSLIKAKNKAEESDRLKSAFLANVSHEIRTPMNGILGFSSLLTTEDLPKQKQASFVDIIQRSGKQLLSIVNDILDISKLESGQLTIMEETFYIQEILDEQYAILEEKLNKQQKPVRIILVNNPLDQFEIKTDRVRLTQVLQNLLSNAEKFTSSGSIKFGYSVDDKTIRFYVTDTGIGIGKDSLETIFDRFTQENDTISREFGGTGLGLSISKGLVELMGGRLEVRSTPKLGSTFSFTIPRLTPDPQIAKELLTSDFLKFDSEKILIVEDVDQNYALIKEYLGNRNLQIIRAITGSEAIDICYKTTDIRLVLMDIKLPELDGYEATRSIRKFNSTLPIIAQTAYAMQDERQKCFDVGCNAYLAKPIEQKDLLNAIANFIKPIN